MRTRLTRFMEDQASHHSYESTCIFPEMKSLHLTFTDTTGKKEQQNHLENLADQEVVESLTYMLTPRIRTRTTVEKSRGRRGVDTRTRQARLTYMPKHVCKTP